MSYSPPPRRPPSKYLALWISLPIIAGLMLCGGIAAALDGDEDNADMPQPVASLETTTPPTPAQPLLDTSSPSAEPSATPAAPAPPAGAGTATTKPATTTPPARTTTTTPPASVYYKNCDAVRAAGKAPLYRGDPGYRAGLDRDGDGIACE